MSLFSRLGKAVDDGLSKVDGAFQKAADIANDPGKRDAFLAGVKTSALDAVAKGADAVSAAAKDPDGTVKAVSDKVDSVINKLRNPPGGDGPSAP